MLNKVILWSMIVIPWLSLLLLRRDVVKRYMPVAIFTSLLMTIYNEIAFTQNHWQIKVKIIPQLVSMAPFVYGAFIPLVIWIFCFTFHQFWLYLITNIGLDLLFAFPVDYFFQARGIYELVNITQTQRFMLFVTLAIVIYGYQRWLESVLKKAEHHDKSMFDIDPRRWFGARERTR
ncbi:hypothetical protein [Paenibacillus alkalitolerans]|uniref:hypothetical protein n=1 Tax=Paenibacillus alkalitolerans TaxID=2799335 RepID=UPI0018F32242|nr:hypothetical protein [Paenibacillus alkalitolerans]